jgi:hypothetical protein
VEAAGGDDVPGGDEGAARGDEGAARADEPAPVVVVDDRAADPAQAEFGFERGG